MASQEIETLASALARVPGLGPRSARRVVLWLVKRRETALVQLLQALAAVRDTLVECRVCGNVDTRDPCGICADPRRDPRQLCVVEDVADLWALDRAKLFSGRYHVLGGRLSALVLKLGEVIPPSGRLAQAGQQLAGRDFSASTIFKSRQ